MDAKKRLMISMAMGFIFWLGLFLSAFAADATLSWDANLEPDAAGYRVYYGIAPGVYLQAKGEGINAGNNLTYSITNLNEGNTYYFTVTAYDQADNDSGYSLEVSKNIPVPDTTPPVVSITSPINGSTVSGTITISANASDNIAVAGVQFKLDGANLGAEDTASPYAITWDTTTTTNSTHTLTAIARDNAGNSAASSTVNITVSNILPDIQAPTTPAGLTATAISSSQINLSWTASTDDVGVTGYKIYRDGVLRGTIDEGGGTSYSDTGLEPNTTYTYAVSAYDAAGNESAQSASVSATTQAPPDTIPPSVPQGLSAVDIADSSVALNWTPNNEPDFSGYKLYRDNQFLAIVAGSQTNYQDTGLLAETAYAYELTSFDLLGNESLRSPPLSVTTLTPPDTTPPTVPTSLAATTISSSQINLSWTASTDNVGVAGYKIYRDDILRGTIDEGRGTSYSDTGLTASTTYSYTISAYDAAGNESGKSTQASATTQAAPLSSKIYKCNPSSDIPTNYKWDPMNFTTLADGKLTPTPASWSIVIPNQEGQIVLDTFRNKKIAFVSGVTLEAPAGTENWEVLPVTNCPPAVWGGSLVYDPINKEAVLIGGTLSINGGSEGTWIYSPQLADWYKLNPSSTYVKQVRSNVDKIKTDLNKLRWDLWKAIEWQTSGRTLDVQSPAVLKNNLDLIKADLQNNLILANNNQSLVSITYEKSQFQGAATWIQDAINKLFITGTDLSAGVPESMEKDYRVIINAYTSIENAEDSLLGEPQPRYFSTVAYDALQKAITLNGGKHNSHSWNDNWIYFVNEHRWERKNPLPGAPASDARINELATDGEYVLRDAATVTELKNWKAQMDSWNTAIAPNTWVPVLTQGTGRPNWGRSWSSIVYDPDRQQIYYRDGGHGSYHGSVTDHYDIPTGRWFRSAQLEEPDGALMGTYFGWGRSYTFSPWAIHTYKYGLFYNPLIKQLQRTDIKSPYILYNSNGVPVNDYNPDTGMWAKDFSYIPAGDDPSITGSPFISPLVPGVPDGLIGVHAYDRYNPRSTSYIWYKNASGIKTWADAGPLPFPHEDHHSSFFFDLLRKRAMYYGGKDTERDVFAFDTTSPTSKWVKLNATVFGGASLPYPSREVVYIPKYDVFLFLEGWKDTYSDTRPPTIWSFDPKNNEFKKIALSFGPGVMVGNGSDKLNPMGVSSGLAYDPISDLSFYITNALGASTMFSFRYRPDNVAPDSIPPTPPINPIANTISSSQVNLSWTASTDNVGVTGYKIYRRGIQIATSATNSYSDTGLSPSTTYSYIVSAYDAAGNDSSQSTPASATTQEEIVDITTGLVGYWRFDEGSGTTATDSSGNNNTGTLVNSPIWTIGKTGGALNFDGLDDYVSIPDNLIKNGVVLTVAAWIKTSKNGVVIGYQDTAYPTNPNQWVPALYVGTDGKLRGEFWQGAVNPITSSLAVSDGLWHHIALVGNTNTQSLYLDGVLVGTLSGNINHLSMSKNQIGLGYTAGSWPSGNDGWLGFNGSIDEVRIYSRALSAGEIKAIYNQSITIDTAPPSTPTNLQAQTVSSSQIDLSWTGSTDNVGVAGYKVYRGGTQIAISATSSYMDTGLSPATTYSYAVLAIDTAGNESSQSTPVSVTTQAETADITSGLVGFWKFDEGSGATAVDSAGQGHDGALINGPSRTTGKIGGALYFDGVDDYVSIPALNISTNTITFTAWINGTNTGNYTGIVYSRSGSQPVGIGYQGTTNKLTYTWNNNSSATYDWLGGPIISQNEWVLVAVTIEPTKAIAYAVSSGGLSAGTNFIAHLSQTLDGEFRIGSDAFEFNRFFNGHIDEIRVYNRTLSTTEIQTIYNQSITIDTAPPSTPTNLQAQAISSSQINLSWTVSTDNVGVAGYKVYRGGIQIATSATNSYTDSGLSPSTTYSYTVFSYDAAGNESGQSSPVSATTQAALPPGPLNVPLVIQESLPDDPTQPGFQLMRGVGRTQEPVTVGIPLLENSGLSSISQLGISGVTVGQFRVLARWPNGNIKWVLVDTQADVFAQAQNTSVSLTAGSGNFGGPNLATDQGSTISVNTGPAQFTIRKIGFNLFDHVVVNGVELVSPGTSPGIVLTGTDGTLYLASNDNNAQVSIEENGPARAVILAKGTHYSGQGQRNLDFTVRIHLYKGKTRARVFYTLRNASKEQAENAAFQSLELVVSSALSQPSFAVSNHTNETTGLLLTGSSIRLFQGENAFPNVRDDDFTEVVWPTTIPGYTIEKDNQILESGSREQFINLFYAQAQAADGRTVTIGTRFAAGWWPQGLGIDGDGTVHVGVFPVENNKPYYARFNSHVTREVLFDFDSKPANAGNTFFRFQYPLVGKAKDVDWYNQTGALWEKIISFADEIAYYQSKGWPIKETQDRRPGFTIWRHKYWGEGGGLNQYDFTKVNLHDFLRQEAIYSGGYFLNADQRLEYNADLATHHTDDYHAARAYDEVPALRGPYGSVKSYYDLVNSDKVPKAKAIFEGEHRHAYGMGFWYYLSGDERFRETYTDWGEVMQTQAGWNYWERGLAWNIYNLVDLYRFTGDPVYRDLSWKYLKEEVLDKTAVYKQSSGTDWQRGFFIPGGDAAADERSMAAFIKGAILPRAYAYFHDFAAADNLEADRAHDVLRGLVQFVADELWFEYSQNPGDFGFHYRISADSAPPQDVRLRDGWWGGLKEVYLTFVYGYLLTGDEEFLRKGELLQKATAYNTPSNYWFQDLPDRQTLQHLLQNREKYPVWSSLPLQVQLNGSGSYTLSWTVPPNAKQYQIKYSDKPIVEWLGFDKDSRQYQYDPSQYTAFFAANNVADEPAPAAVGTTQTYTIAGLDANKQWHFALKYQGGPTISPVPSDTTAPSVPTNLQAQAISPSQINLSWTASTDDVGVVGYKIYRDGSLLATQNAQLLTYSDTSRTASTTYTYTVSAYDSAGNESAKSSPVSATTPVPLDTTAPVIVITSPLDRATKNQAQIIVNGTGSDNTGVASVTVNGLSAATTDNYANWTASLALVEGANTINAEAKDLAGNSAAAFITISLDTTPPEIPQGLSQTEITDSSVTLNWTANQEPDLSGYKLYRDNQFLAVLPASQTSYQDTGLLAETTYAYELTSFDLLGNESLRSPPLSVTTLTPPDTTPPTVPTSLAATTISSSQINLSWTASTDNVGVAGYKIYRDGILRGTIDEGGGTSYSDSGLQPSTTYTYAVSAYDAAGNESARSPSASATTQVLPNTAPVAINQSIIINEDSSVNIVLAAGDAEGNSLTYSVVSPSVNGQLLGTAPDLTYTPNNNFNGADSFSFKANDGLADSNVAQVAITVNPVNDDPILEPIASVVVNEAEIVAITPIASDPDRDALTYTVTGLPQTADYDFDPKTGVLNWRTTYEEAGEYNLNFTVDDGRN